MGLAASGVEDIVTSDVGLIVGVNDSYRQSFRGLSAVLFGILWICVGLVMIVGGVAYAAGWSGQLWGYLRVHPGGALVLAGLGMIAYGGVELLGPQQARPDESILGFLASLPVRLFGLVLTGVGVAVLIGGGLALFAPQTFAAILTSLNALVPRLPQ